MKPHPKAVKKEKTAPDSHLAKMLKQCLKKLPGEGLIKWPTGPKPSSLPHHSE